jgi:Fe-S cluster assembly scaffold protein SufB
VPVPRQEQCEVVDLITNGNHAVVVEKIVMYGKKVKPIMIVNNSANSTNMLKTNKLIFLL